MALYLSHDVRRAAAVSAAFLTVCVVATIGQTTLYNRSAAERAPEYQVDPAWPKPLPNHWILGVVVGVAVDGQDHVWVVHRPSSVQSE